MALPEKVIFRNTKKSILQDTENNYVLFKAVLDISSCSVHPAKTRLLGKFSSCFFVAPAVFSSVYHLELLSHCFMVI